MTSLSFNASYAASQDRPQFGQRPGMPASIRRVGRFASSPQVEAVAGFAGRTALALVPFSALAWMFVAR